MNKDNKVDRNENSNILLNPTENRVSIFNEKNSKFNLTNDVWIPDKAKQNYHLQRLGQSKWAFRLSMWGSVLGFIVIIFYLAKGPSKENFEWVGLVSGSIIEIVAVLFYNLANRMNDKISEFFEKLTVDSNITHALELAGKVESEKVRDELYVKLSLHLSGISEERICKYTNEICKLENLEKD